MLESALRNYYIAYFDILGYKNYFSEHNNDPNKIVEYKKFCIEANDIISEKTSLIESRFRGRIKIKAFSDNWIILAEKYKDDNYKDKKKLLEILINIVARIQCMLIRRCQLLIRGGITEGQVYIGNIVFGKGLISAVELEEKAIYPIVKIDNSLISYLKVTDNLPGYISAVGSLYYVNFYSKVSIIEASFQECENERFDIDKTIDFGVKFFNIVQDVFTYHVIDNSIAIDDKYIKNYKLLPKYHFIIEKFREYCANYGLDICKKVGEVFHE